MGNIFTKKNKFAKHKTQNTKYIIPQSFAQTKEDIPHHTKWNDAEPFIPPVDCGRVIKIYDGDTITIASRIPIPNSPIYRFQVRLNGIDTPEIRSKSRSEKHIAKLARDTLANLIYDKWARLENVTLEKYGRLLADVWVDDICINEWMIEKRFAVKYDGGTKHTPKNWVAFHNNH